MTGRKIIVDTYGGRGRHGGGAFSGKDPTKVDRSACYMARHIAKTVVAAGLAKECEVQVAYAIGVAEPVSVLVDTHGTGKVADAKIAERVRKVFDLTPAGIIKHLDLRRPIYRKTASGGHFAVTNSLGKSQIWSANLRTSADSSGLHLSLSMLISAWFVRYQANWGASRCSCSRSYRTQSN